MITDYDVNIPVMQKVNLSGGENNWFKHLFPITGIAFLLIITQSCTYQVPKLNTHYLPITYSINSLPEKQSPADSKSNKIILLNDSEKINSQIIQFWKRGAFRRILAKEHPYVKVSRSDIETVNIALNKLFLIFYWSEFNESDLINQKLVIPNKKPENCQPLSNHEIQFMLNRNSESAFSSITLNMLIVSAHELLLQKGSTPRYPKVFSPFLRKRFRLPEIDQIKKANLFAEKKEGKFTVQGKKGFVFCRKKQLPDVSTQFNPKN